MNRGMKTVVLMPREGAVKVEEKTWYLWMRERIWRSNREKIWQPFFVR